MIKLGLENFKAFKKSVDVELSKINLFVGANSAGKSTFRSFLSLLKDFTGDVNFGLNEFKNASRSRNADFASLVNRSSDEKYFTFQFNDMVYRFEERIESTYGGTKISQGRLASSMYAPGSKPFFKLTNDAWTDKNNLYLNVNALLKEIERVGILNLLERKRFSVDDAFDEIVEVNKLKGLGSEVVFPGTCLLEIYKRNRHFNLRRLEWDLREYMASQDLVPVSIDTQIILSQFILEKIERLADVQNEFIFLRSDNSDIETYNFSEEDLPFDSLRSIKNLREKLGLDIRFLTIKDESGFHYGHRVQINFKGEWYYLEELGDGLRKLITIITNIDLECPYYLERYADNTLIFLEEPENQLHPDYEIFFANYLIDMVDAGFRHFVIETHSLHIIRAVQLAIAEGRLKPDDVRVYDFSNDTDTGVIANHIPIGPTGLFEGEFKSGFVDLARQIELKLWQIHHFHKSHN